MRTRVTYYANKMASGEMTPYEASLHFTYLDQFQRALELADIIKEYEEFNLENTFNKAEEIDESWNRQREEDLKKWNSLKYNEWLDNSTIPMNTWMEEVFPIIWDQALADVCAVNDREVWLLRNAREARNCQATTDKIYEFFKKYNLSNADIAKFWIEYHK